MPILILLIILDLAIVGWVLYVGVRDSQVIAQGAHTIPDVKSPEVQAKIEPTTTNASATAAPSAPVDTRFIRAERGTDEVVQVRPSKPEESKSVVQIRPPKPEEGSENA
ncbi:MAG: hypothetical protein H7175_20965 [Burkholderiales bacterium]|nr:hypothetical protein [Anaerolineae bacterium]